MEKIILLMNHLGLIDSGAIFVFPIKVSATMITRNVVIVIVSNLLFLTLFLANFTTPILGLAIYFTASAMNTTGAIKNISI